MKSQIISSRTICRVCGHSLIPILSLGDLYVSDFVDGDQNDGREKFPLDLVLCNEKDGGCGLLQLKDTVSHESIYRNYWYRSGINKTMTEELEGIAHCAETIINLREGDIVIDIGSNDSTLLRGYTTQKIRLMGFEPAKNLMEYARDGVTEIMNDFFNYELWKEKFGDEKAKIVTAIAMFYDLEDPNKFVSDVVKSMDENGIFIIQMSYLLLMLSENAFDNICHEHLEYYSLLSLENLLRRNNLEVFDVELNDVNGGSFRIYIKHVGKGEKINIPAGAGIRLESLRDYEKKLGLSDRKIYDDFVVRVEALKRKIHDFVSGETAKGKKVYVYGASTKGNTLLQYCNLDKNLISAAVEKNSTKWGKKTVCTMIPIISEAQARKEKPDYFLVLPWHFMKEFIEREEEFLKNGGKFIVPLPEFKIISDEY